MADEPAAAAATSENVVATGASNDGSVAATSASDSAPAAATTTNSTEQQHATQESHAAAAAAAQPPTSADETSAQQQQQQHEVKVEGTASMASAPAATAPEKRSACCISDIGVGCDRIGVSANILALLKHVVVRFGLSSPASFQNTLENQQLTHNASAAVHERLYVSLSVKRKLNSLCENKPKIVKETF